MIMKKLLMAAGLVLAGAVVISWIYIFLTQVMQPKTRSIPLRHLSGAEAADVIAGQMRPNPVEGWSDREIFVKGRDKDYDKVRDLLQKEDQPTPQVALKFQIIEANGFPGSDSAIAPVESVLRGLFRFQGYRLAAEAFLRTKEESEAQQTIIGQDGVSYILQVKVDDVVRRSNKASAEITVQLWSGSGTQALSTSVNVPDGQTVVLGTARPDAKRGAMILVVTTEIR